MAICLPLFGDLYNSISSRFSTKVSLNCEMDRYQSLIREHVGDDVTMYISQTKVAAGVSEGQALMIEPEDV